MLLRSSASRAIPGLRRRGAACLLAGSVVSALLALSVEPAVAAPAPSAPAHPSHDNPGHSTSVPATPRLASVVNFRDIAGDGTGYTTRNGHHVRRGVFYRSNAMTPSAADLVPLEKLHVTAIYDLRTDSEVSAAADTDVPGAKYVRIPIDAGGTGGSAPDVSSPAAAKTFMQELNRGFVTDSSNRAGFKTLLTDLANTKGAQDFHCTSGKDRTGWAAMLLLNIAGASDADIMKNYLTSNDYLAPLIKQETAEIKAAQGDAAAANYQPLFGVDSSYLQAGLDQLKQSYGSVDNYLTKGLGLSQGTIAKLRAKLVR